MQDSKRARDLRRQGTAAERLLWAQLRNRRSGGLKFRRQYPVGPYIADFICLDSRVVIEVDGEPHDLTYARDARRDAWFAAEGFRMLRIPNDEVKTNLAGVVETIIQFCTAE
jgi:very-short-patch-repair endonuclease